MKKFIFKLFFYGGLISVILVASLYVLALGDVFGYIPKEKELKNLDFNLASEIWSADNVLIGKIFKQNRTETKFNQYPEHLVNALVATEDQRFFEHNGVDFISLGRVLFKTIILQDKSSGGGSTITQQVAKNYFGRKNFGILTMPVTKVKEHILAVRLENVYSKNEILELYFNTVPFGEDVYGIQSASKRFFSKDVSKLKTEEGAVLVGILKANTAYNPRINPENSKKRRNIVLSQMFANGYLNEGEYRELTSKELVINYNTRSKYNPAGYFNNLIKSETEKIIEDLRKENGEKYNLDSDGLKIHTTLNSEMQQIANNSLLEHLNIQQKAFDTEWKQIRKSSAVKQIINKETEHSSRFRELKRQGLNPKQINDSISKKTSTLILQGKDLAEKNISLRDSVEHYLSMLQASLIVLDAKSGAVLSYIGGRNQQIMPYDLVMAKRQMASTFKPFIYATALEQGWKPCDYIDNTQRSYEDYDNWTVKNSDGKYNGHYSMKGALSNSVNVASVATYFRAGPSNVSELANKAQLIDYKLPEYPSVALGVESSSLIKMTNAFGIFARDGKLRQSYFINRIEDKTGKIIFERKKEDETEVISKQNQEIMLEILKAVISNGTGASLKGSYNVVGEFAGKTGTAQNYSDSWFIGFNPDIIVGVWSGFNNPLIHFQGANGYGSRAALPIFARLIKGMEKSDNLKKLAIKKFPQASHETLSLMDCDDFKEDNFFERNFDFLEKTKTSTSREKEKAKKKKNFWKRIFGK